MQSNNEDIVETETHKWGKTLLHPASRPASHVYTLFFFFFNCRKLSLLMRLYWACEGWTTSTPSASPSKINLAVLTIMETSTVDLNVSVTHLRLLRLVQDLNRVKIWGEHCSLQTSPQPSRMAGGKEVQCLRAKAYFSQAVWTVMQRWSAPIFMTFWNKQINSHTCSPQCLTRCEQVWKRQSCEDKFWPPHVFLFFLNDSAGHFHCRNTPTPLLLHLCSATALHYNAVLSQILPLSNNCSFKWFGYCTQAHYNFDYILIDFAALIFP